MTEVLRGWEPRVEAGASPVEYTVTGFSSPASKHHQQMGHDAGERSTWSRSYVAARDLQSPLQMFSDILFVLAWSFMAGLPFAAAKGDLLFGAVTHLWNGLVIAVVALVLERALGSTAPTGVTTCTSRVRQAFKVWTCALAGFLFCEFALKASAEVSRLYLVCFYAPGLIAFGLWRALGASQIARLNKMMGATNGTLVVVGDRTYATVRAFLYEIAMGRSSVVMVPFKAAVTDAEWQKEHQRVANDLFRVVHSANDPAVYLCSSGLPLPRLEALCRDLSSVPVGSYVVPDPAIAGFASSSASVIGTRVAFELRRPPLSDAQRLAKRGVDLALGAIALVLLAPVMVVAAIALKLDSAGPIFFRQMRSGQSGRPFRIFKFRTMNVLEDGPEIRQAERDDPRVTRVGRFLRASSIDELPQLFNVLRGEMSLVGPRPHAVAHDERYAKLIANYELRQQVKPGITGWAQIHGLRGETAHVEDMKQRVSFDIWYALNASLLLDFEIMARTVFEVCHWRKAY
ncbi:exopolysaccharide biosynthesis polyprenyl glycosylphosphotransferase [Rhizomicrobium electricum]|nr:undecaprenyl-phosphate galactose phosphotransferase/putative colanic acid biosynthesis UDP-glucose lipid carrier transferase [Rhizomicrobium electricum]